MKLTYNNDEYNIADELTELNFGGFGSIRSDVKNVNCTYNTFFHVHYTLPYLNNNRWGYKYQDMLSLAYTSLSFSLLKKFNQTVDLYTDKHGAEMLDFLPYDKVDLTLERLKIHPSFFASAKMIALQLINDEDISIDTDILINDGKIINKMNKLNDFVSHKEPTENYESTIELNKDLEPSLTKTDYSYNMGLFRIKNKNERIEYVKRYFSYVEQMLKNKTLMEKVCTLSDPYVNTPDLISEQLNLRNFKNMDTLINKEDITYNNDEELGYTHLIAFEKFNKINKILNTLKKVDKKIYKDLINKWDTCNFKVEF